VEIERRDGSIVIGRPLGVAWFVGILPPFCLFPRGDDLLALSWCSAMVCQQSSFTSRVSGWHSERPRRKDTP